MLFHEKVLIFFLFLSEVMEMVFTTENLTIKLQSIVQMLWICNLCRLQNVNLHNICLSFFDCTSHLPLVTVIFKLSEVTLCT